MVGTKGKWIWVKGETVVFHVSSLREELEGCLAALEIVALICYRCGGLFIQKMFIVAADGGAGEM